MTKSFFTILLLILLSDQSAEIQAQEPMIDPGPSDLMIEEGRIRMMNAGESVFIGEGSGINIPSWEAIKCNTGVGHRSLFNNLQGSKNTAFGGECMFLNKTGDENSAVGCRSLYSNVSGHRNLAVGYEALSSSRKTNDNIAIGYRAMGLYEVPGPDTGTVETSNIAVGFEALLSSGIDESAGMENIAIGAKAIYSNGSGSNNIALGYRALWSNQSGNDNIALGYQTLAGNVIGANNIAAGAHCMFSNVAGMENTATGVEALYSNVNGLANSALGYRALYLNEADANTAIGSQSLASNSQGSFNSALGFNAGNNFDDEFSNSVALGANTGITASNQVRIGNGLVTSIGGEVDWSVVSDSRFKKEVLEDVPGLSFITALRPVTYKSDQQALQDWWSQNFQGFEYNSLNGMVDTTEVRRTGFIAQEVESAAQQLTYDFSGIDAPKNTKDYYSLRYGTFVVPLVKAIQELTVVNQSIERDVQNLLVQIEALTLEQQQLEELDRDLIEQNEKISSKLSDLESAVKELAEMPH